HTEAINHNPAITFCQTGSQTAGRPSLGAWLAYGLGSIHHDLPSYVVMVSHSNLKRNDQPLFSRLWGNGFLPSRYQGVKFRSPGAPVAYLANPPGMAGSTRRTMLDDLAHLNEIHQRDTGDPEVGARIAQYEMAFRMQTSVPELADLSNEPESTFRLYGE